MPLTPEDVSNKRFTPVRLREGYDMAEVDQFLDEVEAELGRLTRENDELRSKVGTGQTDGLAAVSAPPSGAETDAASAPSDSSTAVSDEAVDATPIAVPPTLTDGIKVHTVADASSAAVRLLEIATRNADELLTGAKNDAEQIVVDARAEAEHLDAESKRMADERESEARSRAEALDSETSQRRTQLFDDLEREKARLDGEIENLRAFEREYRSRLKSYFQQQLEALDGLSEAGTAQPGEQESTRESSPLEDDGSFQPNR